MPQVPALLHSTLTPLPAPSVVPLFGHPTPQERAYREAAEEFAAMLAAIADILGPQVLLPYAGQKVWRCGRYVDCTQVQQTVRSA